MSKLSIKTKYRLASVSAVYILMIASRLLYIAYMVCGSDVVFTASDSFIVSAFPRFCMYAADVLYQAAYAMAVCAAVYAVSYFGKRTAVASGAWSVGAFFVGNAIFFIYNIIRNSLDSAQLIAGAFSRMVDVVYAVLVVAAAVLFASVIVGRGKWGRRGYSPMRPVVLTFVFSLVMRLLDLTLFSVVPFFVQYDNITSGEILKIASDYIYYILIFFAAAVLLSVPAMGILKRSTGRLKVKDYSRSADKAKKGTDVK